MFSREFREVVDINRPLLDLEPMRFIRFRSCRINRCGIAILGGHEHESGYCEPNDAA